MTRRQLQIALGLLWLLAGLLQTQRFMFTSGFATQIIAPPGQGQPGFVSGPVHWLSTVIAGHPVIANIPFAAVQLLLGAGLLVRGTARVALAGSIAWALGVWYFGESLSGMASGHASLLVGAPGAALLYAILAAAAWPHADPAREAPARWLPLAWAAVWVGGAVFQVLPGQSTGAALAGSMTTGTTGAPGWLVDLSSSAGGWAAHHGPLTVTALVVLQVAVGAGALVRATRVPAAIFGLALALDFWVVGQHLGGLYSGQATDPNTGPVLALMAVTLLAVAERPEAAPRRVRPHAAVAHPA
ncbi:MAG: hypothetical protein QOC55_1295 [Thermoleophilaceae bacterium]|nr:hypothetical protein [Thermoleophilaceae bacterium]